MPTVKLVDENDPNPLVQEVFRDIKATKKIDFVPNIWRALATHPEHLRLYRTGPATLWHASPWRAPFTVRVARTSCAPAGEAMRDALLAGILAEPDDDRRRAVSADWLEEHGQQARAELIRLQCRLADIDEF